MRIERTESGVFERRSRTASGTHRTAGRPSLATLRPVVLVVDDDADTRELLVELLRDAGARPMEARSAREALTAMRTVVPHVVLTDHRMPDGDGLTLLRAMAADPVQRDIPTLLSSADAEAASLADAAAELGASFLPKPFSLVDVIEAVAAAARRALGLAP
jgi:CheY-like chemotaxis protein